MLLVSSLRSASTYESRAAPLLRRLSAGASERGAGAAWGSADARPRVPRLPLPEPSYLSAPPYGMGRRYGICLGAGGGGGGAASLKKAAPITPTFSGVPMRAE